MLCVQTFKSWFMWPKADSKTSISSNGSKATVLLPFLVPISSFFSLLFFTYSTSSTHLPACVSVFLSTSLCLRTLVAQLFEGFPPVASYQLRTDGCRKKLNWADLKNWRRISGADEEIEEEWKQEEGDKKEERWKTKEKDSHDSLK